MRALGCTLSDSSPIRKVPAELSTLLTWKALRPVRCLGLSVPSLCCPMFISSDPKRAVQLYMKVARDTSPIYSLPEFSQSITLKAAAPAQTHNCNTRPRKAMKTLDLEMAAQDDETFEALPIDPPDPTTPSREKR